MSQAILHLGAPKAGSSTIQSTLAANGRALQRIAHTAYARDSNSLLNFALGVEAELRLPEIARIAEIDRTIFSNEKLFSRISDSGQAKRLLASLKTHFDDVSALCYLRRQDETFVSGYAMHLVSGARRRFSEIPRIYAISFNEHLARWEEALGSENLAVRRFGRSYFAGGDFVSDFCEALALPRSAIREVRFANASPTLEVMELQRLVNASLHRDDPIRRPIVKRLGLCDLPGRRIGLSRVEREAILAAHAETNEWVARRYFDGKQLFDHAIQDDASPEIELQAEDIEALVTNALEKRGASPVRAPPVQPDSRAAVAWCIAELTVIAPAPLTRV